MKYSRKIKKIKKQMHGGLQCVTNGKVYTFNGHGCSQYNNYFDLPPNCVYATLALCGNSTIVTSFARERFYNFFYDKSSILQNPCNRENFTKLNSELTTHVSTGEASIEETDSEDYTFFNIHYHGASGHMGKFLNSEFARHLSWLYLQTNVETKNPIDAYYFNFTPSGLYEMSSNTRQDLNTILQIQKNDNFNQIMLTQENIDYMYKDSLLPKLSTVNNMISSHINENGGENYILKYKNAGDLTLDNPNSYILSITDFIALMERPILLSTLFDKFPGVHYNIVCRPNCNDVIPLPLQRQKSRDNKTLLLEQINKDYIDEYSQLLNDPTLENFTKIITILHTIPSDKQIMLINLQNNDGDTVFHIACRQNDKRIRLLYNLYQPKRNNAGELPNCDFLTLGGNKKTKSKTKKHKNKNKPKLRRSYKYSKRKYKN